MSHQGAIDANIKAFHAAETYDARESMQVLSTIFTKTLLEYEQLPVDPVPVYGDAQKPTSGIDLNIIHYDKSKSPSTSLKIMDFACGTGLVMEKMVPFLPEKSEIVGIDINQAFLDSFNTKVEKLSKQYPTISVHSKNLDILDSSNEDYIKNSLEGKFDKIYCTISYHHLHNYEDITNKVATFLKPGVGKLYIIDFYNEDVERSYSDKTTSHAVQHMGGLKVEALTKAFQNAGLHQIEVAKQYEVNIWQQPGFIQNHCNDETLNKWKEGKLESKISEVEGEVFSIKASIIMAVGTKI
ncbi:hypothetical protein CLIB1423_12S00122 [[Candida] railenensis]|uniref:Methyltransferase domain-containing protein n=1 Tax=[Candida] railenensis TaxID=45579 RepID=A0A9P0QRY3_9ASCO|nr:hypothetical protein CLIB1423_12S00122 [[Candida] railenensis]